MRHNIDVMHVEKNVYDNVVNTLLNIVGKTKDTEKALLGSRSGYIKGLGHGPRPPSSSSKSTHKSHREIELENELKATRELLQSQETRIQHQQSQIAQLASFVSEMSQHMHIPGSSSRSSSPLDNTPLMDS
ncbi:hypothetical protein PVL29_018528 [Vitis rotundifolia]|uniref:Uncharacterized protein n=1 Tax=Vitis rotundifolia TaxID=103349 RepID=A0AA38Z587_VITRO|nr:hypothetical protein PVL29_018528 [Vitis rotundifolia]